MPVRHSTNWTKPRRVNQGSLYAALLWTERTHILGNTQNLELIVQKKKTSFISEKEELASQKDLPAVSIFRFITCSFFQLIYYQLFWSCGFFVTCLLRSIATPNDGNCTSHQIWNSLYKKIKLLPIRVKLSENEVTASFISEKEEPIFLQLIFSALTPLLIFRLIYFQLFWICSLYLTCLLRSIAIPKMEIDLLIKFETHWTKISTRVKFSENEVTASFISEKEELASQKQSSYS